MITKAHTKIHTVKETPGPDLTGRAGNGAVPGLFPRPRFRAWAGLLSLLVSCSICASATAQSEPGKGAAPPATEESADASGTERAPDETGRKQGEGVGADTPDHAPKEAAAPGQGVPTTAAKQPSAGNPADATAQGEEPLTGRVVLAEPIPSASQGNTAPAESGTVVGQRPAPDAGEFRDDASEEGEQCWMRDGFYLRIFDGVGYGVLTGDGPAGSASVSGLGSISSLAIGGSVARRLVLAFLIQAVNISGEFEGGPFADATLSVDGDQMPASETASATATTLGGFIDWYPMESSGLHLGLGAGLGLVMLVNGADDSTSFGSGGGATLLVGYDWPVARTWALGIALVASGATSASLKDSESGDDIDYQLAPFSVGLSASILYF
jgi:hypothetical protein